MSFPTEPNMAEPLAKYVKISYTKMVWRSHSQERLLGAIVRRRDVEAMSRIVSEDLCMSGSHSRLVKTAKLLEQGVIAGQTEMVSLAAFMLVLQVRSHNDDMYMSTALYDILWENRLGFEIVSTFFQDNRNERILIALGELQQESKYSIRIKPPSGDMNIAEFVGERLTRSALRWLEGDSIADVRIMF